jgi:hypothetical protein
MSKWDVKCHVLLVVFAVVVDSDLVKPNVQRCVPKMALGVK